MRQDTNDNVDERSRAMPYRTWYLSWRKCPVRWHCPWDREVELSLTGPGPGCRCQASVQATAPTSAMSLALHTPRIGWVGPCLAPAPRPHLTDKAYHTNFLHIFAPQSGPVVPRWSLLLTLNCTCWRLMRCTAASGISYLAESIPKSPRCVGRAPPSSSLMSQVQSCGFTDL